jgi:hypothetical protein
LEPVWRFGTGSVGHTLLTGFEYQHQTIDTQRSTADLPNIHQRIRTDPAGNVASRAELFM